MANNIPYMTVPGSVAKILEKIKTAATPTTFSYDFLEKTLGFKGGNYKTFVPWAKKTGLIASDGTPSELYKQFRNPSTSKKALGQALKNGYTSLYIRDENSHKLDKEKLKGLVMEITGEPHDSGTLNFMVNTFWNAKEGAEFNGAILEKPEKIDAIDETKGFEPKIDETSTKKLHLGLNYTINLVLPKTDDPSVYNAIFKSLRENLLK